jgi:hypothetical protein
LIHWPIKFEEEQIAQPLRTPEGKLNPAITWSFDFKETWKTLYANPQPPADRHRHLSN